MSSVMLSPKRRRELEARRRQEQSGTIVAEAGTQLPYESAVLEHLTKLDLSRLVANHCTLWDNIPSCITWARFKNILLAYPTYTVDYVSLLFDIIRGDSLPSDIEQMTYMPLPLRSFVKNKIIKLLIQSADEIEKTIGVREISQVKITPVRIALPNPLGAPTEFHLEGIQFESITHAEFERIIRLKYAQSDECNLSDVHVLEDLDLPVHLTRFTSINALVASSRKASYS